MGPGDFSSRLPASSRINVLEALLKLTGSPMQFAQSDRSLRAGMVGMGMIFDETYRPFFEHAHARGLFAPLFGVCQVPLAAVASRTGKRAEAYRRAAQG